MRSWRINFNINEILLVSNQQGKDVAGIEKQSVVKHLFSFVVVCNHLHLEI